MPAFPPGPNGPKPTLSLVAAPKKAVRRPPRARPQPPVDNPRVEAAFGELAARIAAAVGVSEAENSALGVVHELLRPRACFIARYAPDRKLLQVSAVRGRNDARIAAATPGQGPVGIAFGEKRVVREEGLVVAPLLNEGSALGCLAVLSPRRSVSDELMGALAAQVCAGSEVARRRDEGTRRTKDLQTAVAGLRGLERTREELLSNVSHDLKNPLTAIKAYLDMLGRPGLGALNERQAKAVEGAQRSADKLLRMINELLLVSRLESGKMKLADRPFGLKAVAEEVARSLSAAAVAAKVQLLMPPSAEVFVRGDRERIHEAIYALVEHAILRSPAQGVVEVILSAGAGLAGLSVKDGGTELASADLKHLFDTVQRPGAKARRQRGLALPLSAKIVHLHGGRVEAFSKQGEGTRLQLFLPLFAGAVATAPQWVPREGGILLVEDDLDCRDVLGQVLEMEGYRVDSAKSATQAKALLAHSRPALVLLDLRLSEEDGMSVLHYIRQTPRLSEVAVYLISGARDLAALSQGRGINRIDGFFEKPLQVPKVLDTIASVVRPSEPLGRSD